VVLEREVRAVGGRQRHGARRAGLRVVVAGARGRVVALVGVEEAGVGVARGVAGGEPRHGRVGEDERRVAGEQVAAVHALRGEPGAVVEGALVVGHVDLGEPPAPAREEER
jgi:hypothetical protein